MPARSRAASRRCTCPTVPTPIVSPSESWSQPRSIRRAADVDDLAHGHWALPRVTEAHRDVGPHPQPLSRERSTTGRNMAIDSATVRLRFRRAKVSVALPNTATAPTPAARARSRPRSLGTSTGRAARALRHRGARAAPRRRRAGAPSAGRRTRRLHGAQPSSGRAADELGLDRGRHDGRLVLQPVAGPHLVHGHRPGKRRVRLDLWQRKSHDPILTRLRASAPVRRRMPVHDHASRARACRRR